MSKEIFCECDDELVPGALFPWADRYQSDVACVERCDLCKQFQDDELAAAAVAQALGEGYTAVDDDELKACVIYHKGKPLPYHKGEALWRKMRKERKRG